MVSSLEPEVVVVQSRGMERWLSMSLARSLGVCANISFPFPNTFVYDVCRIVLEGDVSGHQLREEIGPDPYTPHILTWRIMKILPECLPRPEFAELRNYLAPPGADLKQMQLAANIAYLFDQYLLFRPEMILRWQNGQENHWQAELWRQLSHGQEARHRAALRRDLLGTLQKSETRPRLPQRVSVFGISALPPFHIEVLDAISRFSEVSLFLMNPCQEYWGDILSDSEIKRAVTRKESARATIDLFNFERGNALLTSTGKLGRDFFDLVEEFDYQQVQLFEPPESTGLLAQVQSDLLHLRDRGLSGDSKQTIANDDRSIQFHSCHSVRREVEVLQDHLLDLFARNPDLKPGEVLVMAPDIEPYAPFVQAVFDLPYDDRRRIPFSIADRTFGRESDVIKAFFLLLELPQSRFEAAQVLSLLETPAIQKQFRISDDELGLIQSWVQDTRIRWGRDAADRRKLGLPELEQNTWQAGLDRLLLGYALPGDGARAFEGQIVPYRHVEGSQAGALGKLADFIERLFALAEAFSQPHSLTEWCDHLLQALERFFAINDETIADLQALRRTLAAFAEMQLASGFDEQVDLRLVRHHLQAELRKEGHGFGFLTGGLTFCSMLPMRSIPAHVLCLIGMNDSAYPRRNKHLGFDLMVQKPRKGDRSRRNDDRYLFLEALLSARELLYISYIGQSVKDNTTIPPSVLITELRDYIAANYQLEGAPVLAALTTEHRLQAFSPAYYENMSAKYFSYSKQNLDAARAFVKQEHDEQAAFLTELLPEPEAAYKRVSLENLYRFFRNPCRFLLNRRFSLYLEEATHAIEETETFALQGLEQYEIANHLIEEYVSSAPQSTIERYREAKLASGELPHGAIGACEFDSLDERAQHFAHRTNQLVQGGLLPPLPFEREVAGFTVSGKLEHVYRETGSVIYRYARIRAKDFLRAWLHHLVLNAADVQEAPQETVLIGVDTARNGAWCAWRLPSVSDASDILSQLLRYYWRGLHGPLPFFPDSALAYCETLHLPRKSEQDALQRAQGVWAGGKADGGERIRGEADDPYFSICFRHKEDPLDEQFRTLASDIIKPILTIREEIV